MRLRSAGPPPVHDPVRAPAMHAAPLSMRGRLLAMIFSAGLGAAAAGWAMPHPAAAQVPPAPSGTPAPVAATPGQERLTQAQLEQLLAPVALYPDTLLTQMLMASTYPLEIVQAKRWRDRNAGLSGAALEQALQGQPWDASVKSLTPFPDVLTLMNDQLEWTQQVGDAVLAQQQDVLNAIQVLRGRAQANGTLQSGPQQTVNVTQNVNAPPPAAGAAVAPPPQVITIAPTQPDTVYLPAYDPNTAYGTWPYPQSPPYAYPPPVGWGLGSALLTGMAFAGGAAIVGGLWGWGSANWGGGDININADRVANINRDFDRANVGSGNRWQHDTTHRQGVAYRGDEVRNRYRGDRQQQAAAREQFRGRTQQPGGALGGDRAGSGARPGGERAALGDRQGGGDRPGAGARPGGGDRPGAGARPGGAARPGADARPGGGDRAGAAARPGGGERPGAGARPGGADRVTASGRPQVSQQRPGGGGGPQGFQGLGDGGRERAAAQRGASSRQSGGFSAGGGHGGGARAAGGGARGGGGGGGRGGRR